MGGLVVSVVALAVIVFVVMVLWGALALSFGFQTIGYGTAALVTLALFLVRSFFRASRN